MNLERIKKINNNEIQFKMPTAPFDEDDMNSINKNNSYKKDYIVTICTRNMITTQQKCTLIYEYYKGCKKHAVSGEYIYNEIYKPMSYNERVILVEKCRIYLLNYYGVVRTPTITNKNTKREIGDLAYDAYNFPYMWTGEKYEKIKYFRDALER